MKVLTSLRARLALAGFTMMYLAVLLVFGVALLSEEESTTTTVDGVEVTVDSSGGSSGWSRATVVLLLPVTGVLAWWWAGRAVRPIDRIRAVAERIEATDLHRRIGLERGPEEVVALASSFDAMIDRLHRSATEQREMLDELSHDLRTPIAVLATNAEVRLARSDAPIEWYRDGFEQTRRSAQRITDVLERYLFDARAAARTIDRRPIDLVSLVRDAVDDLRPFADAEEVRIEVDAPATLAGTWDATAVSRAVTNLVHNAVRHSGAQTSVDVGVYVVDDHVDITVGDQGPGIPADRQAAIFERATRPREGGGTSGLGLSIVRQVAEGHGGSISVESPSLRHATRFVLSLPVSNRSTG